MVLYVMRIYVVVHRLWWFFLATWDSSVAGLHGDSLRRTVRLITARRLAQAGAPCFHSHRGYELYLGTIFVFYATQLLLQAGYHPDEVDPLLSAWVKAAGGPDITTEYTRVPK